LLSQFLGFYRIAGVRQAFCKPGQFVARQLPLTGELEYLGSEQLNFSPWLSGPLFALLQQHHSVKADWIRCGRIRRKGWSIRCSDNAAEADPDASIEIGFVLDLVILSWSCGPA